MINTDFDPDAWIETMMEPGAAHHFIENAIFQSIFHELAKRDKSYWWDGIGEDAAKRKEWHDCTTRKALAVYDKIRGLS
jgi:hypothetical protein